MAARSDAGRRPDKRRRSGDGAVTDVDLLPGIPLVAARSFVVLVTEEGEKKEDGSNSFKEEDQLVEEKRVEREKVKQE